MQYSMQDGWRDENGTPMDDHSQGAVLGPRDQMDIQLMERFTGFRPVDVAFFGAWQDWFSMLQELES